MRLQRSSHLLTAVLLLAWLASLFAQWHAGTLLEQRRQAHDALYQSLKAFDQLADGSQLLSRAVRAYAATGETRHEQAFATELTGRRSRESAIAALQALAMPADEMALVMQAKALSDELVATQQAVIGARRQDTREAALALAYGEASERGEAAMNQLLTQVRARAETRLLAQVGALTERSGAAMSQAQLLVLASMALSLGAILVFFQRRVMSPLAELTDATARMLEGDTAVRFGHVEAHNEIGDLARSLDGYRRVSLETEQQRWIKTGLNDIASALQPCETVAEFAQALLTRAAPMFSCGAAAIYLLDDSVAESVVYRFVGGWGLDPALPEETAFAPGQGLIGQAARDARPLVVRGVPAEQLNDTLRASAHPRPHISTGLGGGEASVVMLVPLRSGEHVSAVLALAAHAAPDDRQWALVQELSGTVVPRLDLLLRNLRAAELLQASREQAQRLQDQQDAQRATERWYSALIESAPDGMLVADAAGRIILTNQRLDALFGYGRGELIGQPVETLVPDAVGRGHVAQREGYQANGTPRAMGTLDTPLYGLRQDGSQLPVEVGLSLLPEFEGRGRCVCAAVRDATDKRARDIELRQARDLAEQATRMKSDFLANMSHEIRTPMNAIVGLSHLALKTDLDARQRDYLAKIQLSSQHLLGLINDILDFSKVEAGKLDLEHTDFALGAVLDNVANLIHGKAADKGLELIFDVGQDIPDNLVGDPLRIGQVLINYCNNAVKFTERGEIEVQVRKVGESADEVLLRWAVRDTGIGLDDAVRARLFRSFSQADSSTSRRYGGSGLGLAISKELAALMRGEVGVDSVPGQGSTFWFTAWLGRSTRPTRALLPAPDLRGQRLLVVDDNDHARQVLAELAASMTFEVDTVGSGAAAVTAVRDADAAGRPYAAVTIDWRMPGLDGIDTARQIRGLGLDHTPRLVLVTAYGREDVLKGAESAGLDAVLIKPVSGSMLYDTLIQALRDGPPVPGPLVGGNGRSALESQLAALAGARVLVVEDNPINQQVARELLADAGFVVALASNGREALAHLDAEPCELVLMDMQMPEMDGLTATRLLRQRPALAALPVIAMTANAMPEHRAQCLAAGMNDHLPKPIEPEVLWQALLRWMRPRPGPITALTGSGQPRSLAELPEPPGPPGPAAAAAGGFQAEPVAQVLQRAGLNVAQGLRRVAGKDALYRDLLGQFAQGQAEVVALLRDALAADDRPEVVRRAHALRGVAGNIGADAVAAAAERVERGAAVAASAATAAAAGGLPAGAEEPAATPASRAQAVAEVDALDAALQPLLDALQAWLVEGRPLPAVDPAAAASAGGSGEPQAHRAIDLEQLLSVSRELADRLARGDYAAMAHLEQHGDLFAAADAQAHARMQAQVRHFDFEAALVTLRAAAAAAGLNLEGSR